jgi:hypothetical protein
MVCAQLREQAPCNGEGGEPVNTTDEITTRDTAESICCAGCGLHWFGGRGYVLEEPEPGEPLSAAFYCPSCSAPEVGHSRRV